MLINTEPQEKAFAVTLVVRDSRTNEPTGKTKTYEADTGAELYQKFVNHVGTQRKGKRRKPSADKVEEPTQP